MTTETSIDEELQHLEEQLDADYRRNVAPGTVLGRTNIDGADFRELKGQTLVGTPNAPLVVNAPGRIVVYDTRTGMASKVPYAQRAYHLSKRRKDGSRVYSLTMPEGIIPPTPIDDTCNICMIRRNGVKRNFYSDFDLLTHYQLFHTLEWNSMERDRDIKERREDANRMERLIMTLVSAVRPDMAAMLPDDVKEQIANLQGIEAEDEAPTRRKRGG